MSETFSILVIDPGRAKCGFAVLGNDTSVLEKGIVETNQVGVLIERISKNYPTLGSIILGEGTNSKMIEKEIKKQIKEAKIRYEEEKNSTLEARKLYFIDNPPSGIWKYIPLGLQHPPVPIDDYAAIVIGMRYLARVSKEQ
ncbi:MAG: hypothetical protein HQM08_05625 [Candidatus Riflebacteria bacterium]|nr:hypothetical protein [Candidatus Riflebacteria bacterium]